MHVKPSPMPDSLKIYGDISHMGTVVILVVVPIPFLASAPCGSLFLGVILRLSNKQIQEYLLMHALHVLF